MYKMGQEEDDSWRLQSNPGGFGNPDVHPQLVDIKFTQMKELQYNQSQSHATSMCLSMYLLHGSEEDISHIPTTMALLSGSA